MTKKISLIIPAKNEVESLETVLLEVEKNYLIGEIRTSPLQKVILSIIQLKMGSMFISGDMRKQWSWLSSIIMIDIKLSTLTISMKQ